MKRNRHAVARVLISADLIQKRVAALGRQISRDYDGQELVLVGVLKGAFVFMADLARNLAIPVRCDFIRVSSYGNSQVSSGIVRIEFDATQPLRDQHVLLIEDIVDTGLTARRILDFIHAKAPKSVKLCALLKKRGRQKLKVPAAYVGFEIPNKFVVGYGLDYAGMYRNLPHVATLSPRAR